MSNTPTTESDGVRFIRFILRHKKILIFSIVLSVIASVVVTFIMEPEFESTGIIFPTPTNSPDKMLANPQFGYEVDADWLTQVLQSEIVRDSLDKTFDLVNYFKLDKSETGWMDQLRKKYDKMLDFERTKYMSIEISATTRDPQMSADIVNFIIDNIDPIRENIFKANTYQTLIHFENSFFEKNRHINSLIDSIYELREHNTSTSLDLLYNQIKATQKKVDNWRDELNIIRNKYKFYDLESRMEMINKGLTGAKSNLANEKGKHEVYLKSYSEQDTIIINTKARIEGATSNIAELENDLIRFDSIKKQYDELTEKINAGLEQLKNLNVQYENTINAFEPYVNSVRLERLSNDYAHQQLVTE